MKADFFADADDSTYLEKAANSGGGEWAGPCPFCGGVDRFRIQPYKNRWLCRHCTDGSWKSPEEFYRRLNGHVPSEIKRYQMPPNQKNKVYRWMENGEHLLECFESFPDRVALWQAYKPISKETIERMRLGVGHLPSSSCIHKRLIVPIFDNGTLVGLRGRAIDCSCAKWMSSAGTTLNRLPLYNQETLTSQAIVWLVENPIDSLMISEATKYTGLSTYSTSYWRSMWTTTLRNHSPVDVMVAFDNDTAGQQQGIKLVKTLRKAGITAHLYAWKDAPEKMDVGMLLSEKIRKRNGNHSAAG